MFSRKDATRQAYEARIDALFSGAKPKQPGVKMLDEADTLTITGYGNLPVTLAEKHAVVDGSKTHPLTAEQWKQIPDWIDNPAAMFERLRDGHITLIGPQKIGGKAVVIALEPQMQQAGGRGSAVNHLMLTAYAKDTGTMPLRVMIERGDMKPLYIDQKKASEFYAGSGVQFPGSGFELRGFNRTLKTERDLVKYRAERDRADTADAPRFSRKAGDAQQQFKDTERAYGGRAAYEQAKAAGKTKLTYGQWVQVRTPNFKQWFGDWEAVRAQQRLDAMEPVTVELPKNLQGADIGQLREAVKARLDALAESGTTATHPEVGEISFSKGNNKKVVSTSAVPEKLHAAHDIVRVIESAVHVGSVLSGKPEEVGHGTSYHTLATKISAVGKEFVALVTVKQSPEGKKFYNTVAVDSGQEKAPAAYPGDRASKNAGSATAFTGAGRSVLPAMRRVNPAEVSKVIDPETGEPRVEYPEKVPDRITVERTVYDEERKPVKRREKYALYTVLDAQGR